MESSMESFVDLSDCIDSDWLSIYVDKKGQQQMRNCLKTDKGLCPADGLRLCEVVSEDSFTVTSTLHCCLFRQSDTQCTLRYQLHQKKNNESIYQQLSIL